MWNGWCFLSLFGLLHFKAFNHAFRPASHFPLLSPVFVKWRQRGWAGGLNTGLESGRLDETNLQAYQKKKKRSTHVFPNVQRDHVSRTLGPSAACESGNPIKVPIPQELKPSVVGLAKRLIPLPFIGYQPVLDMQLGKDVWRGRLIWETIWMRSGGIKTEGWRSWWDAPHKWPRAHGLSF